MDTFSFGRCVLFGWGQIRVILHSGKYGILIYFFFESVCHVTLGFESPLIVVFP